MNRSRKRKDEKRRHRRGRSRSTKRARGPSEKRDATREAARVAPEGAALAEMVARVLSGILRNNPVRKQLRAATGAADEALDAALLSAAVQQTVREASTATIVELNVDLLAQIYKHARRQQPAPLRLVAENTPLRDVMLAAARRAQLGSLELNPFELEVVKGVIATMRSHADEPAPAGVALRSGSSDEPLPDDA
jgi:hypothetical protein